MATTAEAAPSVTGLIDAIEEVLTETLALARSLDPADGALPTGCPGWTVQDNLAHMVGLEQVLAGAPEPDIELPDLDHVRDDFGAYMERHVHIRRPLPFVAVVDELAGLLPCRIGALRELAATGDALVTGPFGERPLSVALPIRVFDLWAHEQDIRRAVGQPARAEGPAAAISLERALLGWTRSLSKADLGIDGELTIEITGPEPSTVVVSLGAGGPTATLRGDLDALTRSFCGRGQPDPNLLSGDPALVAALADHLAMTP